MISNLLQVKLFCAMLWSNKQTKDIAEDFFFFFFF